MKDSMIWFMFSAIMVEITDDDFCNKIYRALALIWLLLALFTDK